MQGVKYTGVLSAEELAGVMPSAARLDKGPVAVIECVQQIPCNPCTKACPFGAIFVGEDITELPRLDEEKCRGCGVCVSKCPGLAIFIVDNTYSQTEATVTMPFEYFPLPQPGDIVEATNRSGEYVCRAKVLKIDRSPRLEGTTVVTLAVPKECSGQVRSMRPAAAAAPVYVCRCCEVTEDQVRQAVRDGAHTVTAVKLATRAGMGLCQGRTCRRLIARIITEETGQNPADVLPPTSRPPVRTVALDVLAGGDGHDK